MSDQFEAAAMGAMLLIAYQVHKLKKLLEVEVERRIGEEKDEGGDLRSRPDVAAPAFGVERSVPGRGGGDGGGYQEARGG